MYAIEITGPGIAPKWFDTLGRREEFNTASRASRVAGHLQEQARRKRNKLRYRVVRLDMKGEERERMIDECIAWLERRNETKAAEILKGMKAG